MLVSAVVAVVGVNVVGAVAYGVSMVNWHGVVCSVRGKHSMDMWTHTCKCGRKRTGAL
jgi:hypothetical protein